jgi:RNA polymerase sigma-70 factor (ECF subfamily)
MRGMSGLHGDNLLLQNDLYESFVQVFARHEPGLRAFVRPLVRTADDVDEVIQQTCVVLWRKYGDFQPGSDFLSWAGTIARFEVLKFRRSRARDRHLFGEELICLLADEGLAEANRREDERRALDACLQRLPVKQRELIERCYGGGVSINQVAESLGRSATSLYKALNRIRQSLLECIERSLAQEALP